MTRTGDEMSRGELKSNCHKVAKRPVRVHSRDDDVNAVMKDE